MTVAVTAAAHYLPGLDLHSVLQLPGPAAAPSADVRAILGRKGLLGKETATRYALVATHRALGFPDGERPRGAVDPDTAVVVSSNLGNVGTVVAVARTARRYGNREVSPLDVPNASSNVVASTIALWFGLGGPNVMVCSGATGGADAVLLGARLLRAGRARRVVVVGVEPADEVAVAVNAQRSGAGSRQLRGGAACLVLEPADPHPTAPILLGGPPSSAAVIVGDPEPGSRSQRTIVLSDLLGDTYGAAGVLYAVAATMLLAAGADEPVLVVCGDPVDGRRVLTVRRGRER
ncbi:beta-ketoacyl synthase N-terminal-like domain-containing protein [Nocardia sp. NPDC051321]|uniref:beta-ketoacyl synthase N-terminal-like domain-containing protein n=1 Tax=Nocardia sp. NPDC051321 TaxID=3364323 RepID=UPI00378B64CC